MGFADPMPHGCCTVLTVLVDDGGTRGMCLSLSVVYGAVHLVTTTFVQSKLRPKMDQFLVTLVKHFPLLIGNFLPEILIWYQTGGVINFH